MDEHYLKYDVEGLQGIRLDNNDKRIDLKNNPYIKEIYLNDDLSELYVYLKEGVDCKESKEQIDRYLNGVLFNFLIKDAVVIECAKLLLRQEYGGNQLFETNTVCVRNDPVITNLRIQSYVFYDGLEKENFVQKSFIEWQVVFSILQNPNPVIVFLLLYDYTKEKKGSQKKFVKYLQNNKEKYEPDLTFQKDDWGNTVDILTYTRNRIGHCKKDVDYPKLADTVSSGKIRLLLRILNNIIMESWDKV